MSLQPNFEVLWIEQVLKNQVKPMLPSTLSTSLPSKDTKKASETAYSQIRCQRCFIFSLLNSPQPLISRGFPSFPTSSRMVSRQNVLFVIYSVKLHIRSKSSFNDLVSSKISTVHPLYQSCSRKDQQRKHNCHGYQNFTDCRSPLPLLFYKSLIYV